MLTVSMPIIADAVDSNEEETMTSEMYQEMEKISNTISVVHYSGNGSTMTVEVDLPAGCEISIGGEGTDAYSMRASFEGECVSTIYFEKPTVMIPSECLVTGHSLLMLESTYFGDVPGIEVIQV